MDHAEACFFLAGLTRFSVKRLRRISEYFGGPEALSEADLNELSEGPERLTEEEFRYFDAERQPDKLSARHKEASETGVRFAEEGSICYPERLYLLDDRPFGMFYKGKLPSDREKAVAVIGARRCSEYGRDSARFFAESFASSGVNVISGMALGADGYAGEGAAKTPGRSYAVLAGGPDHCYPRENVALYRTLSEAGGILSEKPPLYRPTKYDFPLRNRLISALCDAVVIIEATEKSGTLITADYALMQGKEVFALPGRITDRLSEGCLKLIQNGANLLASPADVLQFLGVTVMEDRKPEPRVRLDPVEEAVWSLFGNDETSFDLLLDRSLLPVSELTAALVRLEMKGLVTRGTFGGYRKKCLLSSGN